MTKPHENKRRCSFYYLSAYFNFYPLSDMFYLHVVRLAPVLFSSPYNTYIYICQYFRDNDFHTQKSSHISYQRLLWNSRSVLTSPRACMQGLSSVTRCYAEDTNALNKWTIIKYFVFVVWANGSVPYGWLWFAMRSLSLINMLLSE